MFNINNLFPNINSSPLTAPQEKSRADLTPSESLAQSEKPRLSPLAQIVYSNRLTDLNFSSNRSSYAYYADDNSVAMHASSDLNTHFQEQSVKLDLTFSAEALGLEAKDFGDNSGKPITTKFYMAQTITSVQYSSTTQIVRPTRSAMDVLKDLVSSLSQAMRKRGNKSVRYVLDAEALKAILSDGEMTKMMASLVMLMAAVNLAKETGPSKDYVIYVSGKGKPFLDHQEKTDVESRQVSVELNITINPPAPSTPAAVSAPAAASLPGGA